MAVERSHFGIVGCNVHDTVGHAPFAQHFEFGGSEAAACADNLQCRVEHQQTSHGREPREEVLVSLALAHIEYVAVEKLGRGYSSGQEAVVYHAYLRRVCAEQFDNVALGVLADCDYMVGLLYELLLVRDGAVVYEYILREAFECHVVYSKHEGTLAALDKGQEVGAVVCRVEYVVSTGAQSVQRCHTVCYLVDAAAYTVVLGEGERPVLAAVCICHIVVLAEDHRQFACKFV